MIKSIGVSFALWGALVASAGAQQTAAIDPNGPIPSFAPVVAQCEIVAENPEQADVENGICITSTISYVTGLRGSLPPGLQANPASDSAAVGRPAAAVDQAIADLVIELSALAQIDELCNEFDDEIAAAIRFASTNVSTTEQATLIEEIALTIEECDIGATAAVLEEEIIPEVGSSAVNP